MVSVVSLASHLADFFPLQGQIYLQTFTPHYCTEARMVVKSPDMPWEAYPRMAYNGVVHQDYMSHHNNVTRRLHFQSPSKIKVCGIWGPGCFQ